MLAVLRRERAWLALAGAAIVWVGVEIGFAYHGWPASQRYLMEAAAVSSSLAGAGVGRLLDFVARGSSAALLPPALTRVRPITWILRVAALASVVVLGLALAPIVRHRANLWRAEIHHAEQVAVPIDRLHEAVMLAGGPAAIKACGAPVTFVGYVSALAWNVGINVGDVGYKPRDEFASGKPIVFFRQHDGGWTIRPVHTPHVELGGCDRLFVAYHVPAAIADSLGLPAYQLAAVKLPAALVRLRRFGVFATVFPAVRHAHHARHLRRHRRATLPRRSRLRRGVRRPGRAPRRPGVAAHNQARASVSGAPRRRGPAARARPSRSPVPQ